MTQQSQVVRTTIQFQPSFDIQQALASGNLGQAKYRIKVNVNGEWRPQQDIPAGAASFEIEAPLGADVGVMMDAVDRDGTASQASAFQFRAGDRVPPARPRELVITDVKAVEKAAVKLPQAPADDEPQIYNATITGHPEIKDGAVGQILGLNPNNPDEVFIGFDAAALKPGVKPSAGGLTDFLFNPAKLGGLSITVVTPSQDTISLADYVRAEQSKALTAA